MAVQCDVIDSLRVSDMDEEMETAASLLQHDVNQLKFSAIKVDVTSLRTSRRRLPVVVVVISSLTSSRDVIKMVVQKIGMNRKQAELMQMVAVVDRKQLQHTTQVGLGEGSELVLADVDCPLSVFSLHPKHSVSFYLRWKPDDVNHNFSSREDRLQQQRTIAAENLLTQPAVALSHFLHQSNSNGSTLPGHQPTGGQFPVTIRSPSSDHHHRHHQQQQQLAAAAAGIHGPPCRLTSSHSGFEADPDPPSEMYQLAENVRRWSMSNGGDCLIHYEPQLLDFQAPSSNGTAARATGYSTYNGNGKTGHQSTADRCSESPLVLSSGVGTSTVVMRVKKSDRERLEQNQSADTAGQNRFRKSQPSETPTSGGKNHLQRSDSSSRHHQQQQLLCPSGSAAVAAAMQLSTFRPYSNLAAACSDGEAYDDSPGTSKDPPGGTSSSVHGSPSFDAHHRPLIKFSSLPNVEQLEESAVDGGGDGLSRCREDLGLGAGAIGARQTATYCSLDKPSTFVSMPCISACGRGGRTPKRFLPSLTIPEEVVEAKRHSLSLKLNEKLQKVAKKASTSRQHSKNSSDDKKKNSENKHNSFIRVSSFEDGRGTRRTGRAPGSNQDDDCVSMTSREVAEILSTAAPMAPPSDDEEEDDDNNNNNRDSTADDDEGLVDGSSYCDDESSAAGVDQYRLSSAMQLLHVDDASSTSSSNTIDGESSSSAKNHRQRRHQAASDGQCSTIFPPAPAYGTGKPITNGLCRWSEHAQSTRLNGGMVNGPGSAADGTGMWNGFRVGGGVVERQLTLFSLLQTHELSLVYMERHFNDIDSRIIPPFQVINDVVSFPDSCPDPDGSRRILTTKLKFTVPIVTGVTKDRRLWSMTSENGFNAGDMLVEVNGVNVLRHSAAQILALTLNSSTLHLVLARQRPRADQWVCPASATHHL